MPDKIELTPCGLPDDGQPYLMLDVEDCYTDNGNGTITINETGTYHIQFGDGLPQLAKFKEGDLLESQMQGRTDEYDNPVFADPKIMGKAENYKD